MLHYNCVLFVAFAVVANAHLCLLWPPQRGNSPNISVPGSNDCFQPQGPCGTKSSSAPTAVFYSGQSFQLSFQQNLNHYNPGWPGSFTISISTTYPESSFTTIFRGGDYWSHWQGSQTNYTVVVTIPANITCSHCVLQIMYNPNKPTEPWFHQCADITVNANPNPTTLTPTSTYGGAVFFWGGANVPTIRSEMADTFYATCTDPSKAGMLTTITFNGSSSVFPVEGLGTYVDGALYYVVRNASAAENYGPAWNLLKLQMVGNNVATSTVTMLSGVSGMQQLNAFVESAMPNTFVAIGSRPHTPKEDYYDFHFFRITTAGVMSEPDPQAFYETGTYVNFFWSSNSMKTADGQGEMFAFIAGNENDYTALTSFLVTVTMPFSGGSVIVSSVAQDVSHYTLSNLFQSASNSWYGVSAGRVFNNQPYEVVTVVPSTGAVTGVSTVQSIYTFRQWWGGGVSGNNFENSTKLIHSFRVATTDNTKLTVLGAIDTPTGNLGSAYALYSNQGYDLTLKTPVYVPGVTINC